MKNVKAVLLTNTDAENLTVENFYDSQEEMSNPMVIFLDTTTNKVIKYYRVAAETMEQLKLMFELKYFDTPDLPEEEYEKFGGGYFVGCGPTNKVINKGACRMIGVNKKRTHSGHCTNF